jgi:periplasmic copper chaperone A
MQQVPDPQSTPRCGPGASAVHRLLPWLGMLALAAVAAVDVARAADAGVSVRDPWMRFIVPMRPAAGYFTLTNETASSVVLVGAESPACGMLMLHRSEQKNGVDRMLMVDKIPVPAHGTVKFAPGGYHLMCMSPKPQLARGQSVPVTLRFADGSSVTASFPVRGPGGK